MAITPFPCVTLTGGPESRGRQYGQALKPRIHQSVALYGGALDGFGMSAAQKTALIADYARRIGDFDERYVEEMHGIAAGAGVAFEDIVMINARTEVMALARAQSSTAAAEDEADDGCTGAILLPERSASGNLIHAQNWDWRAECANTGVVLRVRQDHGPDYLTFVEAGGLARSGLNAAGVSITANYLECDRDYQSLGVPLGLIRRKVLEQEHFALAAKVVATTPKSCSNNIMIASAAGFGIDFECAPDEAFPLYPDDGLIVHANHWVGAIALSKLRDTGIPHVPESFYRDWRVRRLLQAQGRMLDREGVKAALFDDFLAPYSVCRPARHGDGGNLTATVAMIVMEPALGVMEIAPMPAANRRFTTYRLDGDEPQDAVDVRESELAAG